MDSRTDEILSLGLSDKVIISNLSNLLATIARIGGVVATLRFAEKYGGRRLYFPKTATEESNLAAFFGVETAQQIVDELGGGRHIEITAGIMGRDMTRLIGLRMLQDGAACYAVAHAQRVSLATVVNWKRKYLGDGS